MPKVQNRLREFMTTLPDDGSDAADAAGNEAFNATEPAALSERERAEEEKRVALERLGKRVIARPEKKISDDPSVQGRYIKPEQLKQAEGAKENQGGGKKAALKKMPKETARLIRKLRGIAPARKKEGNQDSKGGCLKRPDMEYDVEDIDALADSFAEGAETVKKQEPDLPDETVFSDKQIVVGVIYWDEYNGLADRIVTVHALYRRSGDLYADAFCHDLGEDRIIALPRVVRLYDAFSMKPYSDAAGFLRFAAKEWTDEDIKPRAALAPVLSVVRYELSVLVFIARIADDDIRNEYEPILNYIRTRCADIPFDTDEILNYISSLYPDEQSFYEAADVAAGQPCDVVTLFAETFLRLMMSDGMIHDAERELLAELLYILRSEGIELNILGLR